MGVTVRCVPPKDVALSHLLENLAASASNHSLSTEFMRRFSPESLSFYVITFRELSERELTTLQWAYGGRGEAYELGYSSVDVVIDEASSLFKMYNGGTVVLEHPFGKRGDAGLQNRCGGVRFFMDEVYSIITSADAHTVVFEQAILEARRTDQLVGFFIAPNAVGDVHEMELPQNFPADVCDNWRVVFTDAFDGEGLLFGKRQN